MDRRSVGERIDKPVEPKWMKIDPMLGEGSRVAGPCRSDSKTSVPEREQEWNTQIVIFASDAEEVWLCVSAAGRSGVIFFAVRRFQMDVRPVRMVTGLALGIRGESIDHRSAPATRGYISLSLQPSLHPYMAGLPIR